MKATEGYPWRSIAPYPGVYQHDSGSRARNTKRVFDHKILAVILRELLLKHGVKPRLQLEQYGAKLNLAPGVEQ